MQTESIGGQQAAVWRGHNRVHFVSQDASRYVMILNTLEKRGLGGFPGEETHCMPLASAKGKATLEGTKAFIPAYFSAGGNKMPVLCFGSRGSCGFQR